MNGTTAMLDVAIEAAREAGSFLLESVGKVRNLEIKKGNERNLVSEIDRMSEEMIIRHIKGHFPSHQILAEESGGSDATAGYKWVIDPLDGTTNFVHGIPIFCVTLGIEHKGEIVAGVVYDPNFDELYSAEKGSGAFLNGQRLRVSDAARLMDSLLVTGFPYDIPQISGELFRHFSNFLLESQGVRRLGSAAMDFSYTAAGRFDGYWEVSLNPWDMAAGILLVTEAGGRVTDFSGGPPNIYRRQVLASNGRIHDAMLGVLQKPAPWEH